MFAAVLLTALLSAVVLGMVISIRGGPRASRRLRWAVFGLTLTVIAALTPFTVEDSGASSLYLLGVPAVAAAVPLVADLTGFARLAADLCGAAVMVHAFVAFARQGRGTPAPPVPTERLVVSGAYRFVRNPMYVAVVALVLGQVLLFASWALLAYLVLIAVAMDVFVRTYEEPTLRATYGPAYDEFREAVPRWLPRVTPWRDSDSVGNHSGE